jgi:hypothetical protein
LNNFFAGVVEWLNWQKHLPGMCEALSSNPTPSKKEARKESIAGGVAQVVECLSNNIFASIPQNIPFSSV